MIIDAHRPIADGICFDDLDGLTLDATNMLASRGVVFLTEFEDDGSRYGGTVIAATWQMAKEVAFGRGLGEKVIGQMAKAIPAKNFPTEG